MFDYPGRVKPILKWAGGKSNLLPRLHEAFPRKFERYFEPFLGGASVFLSLRPGVAATVGDSIPDLIVTYRVIRDHGEALMGLLDDYRARYSEEFFRETREQTPRSNLETAARLIFLNKTCFNGLYRTNAKGRFNVPFGKKPKCPPLYDRENFARVAERFASASMLVGDFEDVIAGAGDGDLVYCDPPYAPVSATARFDSYTPGGFSAPDHDRLRKACELAAKRGATVVVTNSATDFVKNLYANWDLQLVNAPRLINSKGSKRGAVSEVLATYNSARGN